MSDEQPLNEAHTHLVPVLATVEAAHLLGRLKQVLPHLVHLSLQDVEGLGGIIGIQPLVILLKITVIFQSNTMGDFQTT